MSKYILGIDTSSYTTSIAAVDVDTGLIVADLRKVLSVPKGQKGLRQQEAVFQHIKNFEELFEKLEFSLDEVNVVSLSSKPRNQEGSYMPVFTVGQNYGKVIAKTINCECLEYSHQENHIAASLVDNYKEISNNILAVHISGGTTEFLSVIKDDKGFSTEIVGGTKDITFGQLIDRIGTAMGFAFPCGLHLEKSIQFNNKFEKIKYPSIRKDAYINLSGMENYYMNLIENDKFDKVSIIYSLFEYISECLINIIETLKKIYFFNTIIITGGVASNSIIRELAEKRLSDEFNVIFPTKNNSSDNAVGLAYLPLIDRWYNETKTN